MLFPAEQAKRTQGASQVVWCRLALRRTKPPSTEPPQGKNGERCPERAANPGPGRPDRVVQPEPRQENLFVAAPLNPSDKKKHDLLESEEPQPIDDTLGRSGLNSSEVLARLF